MNNKTIEVTKRPSDYHACLMGDKTIWGCGRTISEAIGNAIINHPEKFNLDISENITAD